LVSITAELEKAKTTEESLITIGVFDGVHMGHRSLISQLISQAKSKNLISGVVTFSNHPGTIINKNFEPNYLTSLQDRLKLIEETGVDFVVPVTFTEEVANLKAEEFTKILQNKLKMKGLMVGPDFQMGKGREANVKKLETIGENQGFKLTKINVKGIKNLTVRSTSVREALKQGKIEEATEILGRRHSLKGTIVLGEKRGRDLGFPTANFDVPADICVPSNGIYATFIYLDKQKYLSATSVGTNPTFNGQQRTIETYIMDFARNIYGSQPKLEFVSKLRDEVLFDSIPSLIEQMNRDVEKARDILNKNKSPRNRS